MKKNICTFFALLSFTATVIAADKYYVSADIVRGAAGAQGAVCVANSVFHPGEQIVWRAMVFDAATNKPLEEEEAKKSGVRVTVALENGTRLNMRLGLHPPNPKAPVRELFWAVSYPVPATAPLGTMKWTMAVEDINGNKGGFTPIGQGASLNLLTIAKPAAPRLVSQTGQGLYDLHCGACHQANGEGMAGVYPALTGSRVVTGDGTYLSQVILFGLEGPISIKGQTINGNMPGLGVVLDDAQLALVASYIRAAWGNKAAPVGADIVKAARSKVLTGRENHARYPN